MSSGRTKVIPDDRLHVDDDLLGAGEGHHQVLLVDVPPAGEQAVGGQEEEQVLPLQPQVVLVEHLQHHRMKDCGKIILNIKHNQKFYQQLYE